MCFSSITSLSIYFHLILMSNLVLIFLIAIFKIIFLIDFFFLQFHPSIFNLFNFYVEFNPNSFKFFCVVFLLILFFFCLLLIGSPRSHDLGHRFEKLAQVDFDFFVKNCFSNRFFGGIFFLLCYLWDHLNFIS